LLFPFKSNINIIFSTRDEVQLVPKTIASQKLEDIAAKQTALLSLFLEWECLTPFKASNRELITPSSQILKAAEGHTLPHSYSSFDMNWKIRTTPNAKQNLEDIKVEQSILLALLPDWECPGSGQAVMLDKLGSLCYNDTIIYRGSGSYTLPPTYPIFDPN
jgi:hypothetical protein